MLKSCCCGVPLKKGTIIIGILSAIGSALSCIIWVLALILLTVVWNQIAIGSSALDAIYIIAIVSYSFGILIAIGQFAMAIILVRGARKEDPKRIRIYLIYGTVMIVLSLISSAVSAIGTAGFAVYAVIAFALQAYFLVVIWSYYKELLAKDTDGQGVVYPPPSGYPQPAPGYAQPSPGYAQPPPGYAQPTPGHEKPSPLGPNSDAVFLKA